MNNVETDDDKNPTPPGSPEIAPVKDPEIEEDKKTPVKDPQPPHKKEKRLDQR